MRKRFIVVQSLFLRLIGLSNNRLSIAATHDAALLAENGAEVVVYNPDATPGESTPVGWRHYCEASSLLPVMLSCSGWTDATRELAEVIDAYRPDGLVYEAGDYAVPAKDQNEITVDLAVGGLLKQIAPALHTVVVGFSPTMHPGRYADEFDAVVTGVPGSALADVLSRRGEGVVTGEGAGPYLCLVPHLGTVGSAAVDCSRVITELGCHYGLCSFCPNALMHGRGSWTKNADTIIKDILLRREETINVVSNDFGHDVCERPDLASRLRGTDKQFVADVRAEIARTKNGVRLLQTANVRTLKVGVEHLSPLLERRNKGQTAASVRADLAVLKEAGFEIVGYLLLGAPGDRPEFMRETISQAEDIRYVTWLPNFYSDPQKPDCHDHHFSVANARRRGVPEDVIADAIALSDRPLHRRDASATTETSGNSRNARRNPQADGGTPAH